MKAAGLERRLGLTALAATGICSMLGAAVNVLPITMHRSVPGIGPYVLPAYVFGALPAVLAAVAYASLASAMPRAGGSYVFVSRSISPYWGFVASFSQWFGLSVAIGVVSYVTVPFLVEIASAVGWPAVAQALETGPVRVAVSLAFLWTFVLVNIRGLGSYQWTLVPMMFLMFALGSVAIVAGFAYDHGDFAMALQAAEGRLVPPADPPPLRIGPFLAGSAILFSSFIGFDSIAQAGGEAKRPARNLPLAIGLAVTVVGGFYFLYTAAIYHAVPWSFIAQEAQTSDIIAPGLLGYVLPVGWTVAIVAGMAVALINDLPAMLLAVSRLVFAWAEDGIFPARAAAVHPRRRTPHVAILGSAVMATAGILGSHLAGDFMSGVAILVTSMLVNFLLMCLAVLVLPRRNPTLAAGVTVAAGPVARGLVGVAGTAVLALFLAVHIWNDLTVPAEAWYFRSTPVWVGVMLLASVIFFRETKGLRNSASAAERFRALPPE